MITIITSTLNALPQLKHTADSIFQQSSTDWQWIIVDGASSDGTKQWLQDIAQSYSSVDFISEPDHGIYDAWNKALTLVRGEWVLFLGAGDKFKSSEILKTCIPYLEDVPSAINLAYGFVEYIDNLEDDAGKLSPARWVGVDGKWTWCRPMLPNHQAVFHRRSLFARNGGFDATYRIAGDTAIMLPELMNNGSVEFPLCITLRHLDGISLEQGNRLQVLREVLRINRDVGLSSKHIMYQYIPFFYHTIKSWLARKSK